MMMPASKGHVWHACMSIHDFGTAKHQKVTIFRRKMSGFEVFSDCGSAKCVAICGHHGVKTCFDAKMIL